MHRSIAAAERAVAVGDEGLSLDEAAANWGELPADWVRRSGFDGPDDEPVIVQLVERAQLEQRRQNILDRWRKGEFVARGFPLHDPLATGPVLIPSDLRRWLLFDRLGGARNDLVLSTDRDGVTLVRHRRDEGIGIRRYASVRFYLRRGGVERCESISHEGPKDSLPLRHKAKAWLRQWVDAGNHVSRDKTIETMRAEFAGISGRGAKEIWREVSPPGSQLSRSGRRKSKRHTNNRRAD
jgi:hypothetical protein